MVVALRFPAAARDVRALLARTGGRRLSWPGATAATQALSLAASAPGQHRLLAAGLEDRSGLALGYAGLASLISTGQVLAAAWLAGQYHRRGAGRP